jgi:hypothetical protein
MIQRIQTIYLLLSVALMVALNWLPLTTYGELDFFTYGISTSVEECTLAITTYPIAVTVIASTILALIAIFMYTKRMKQVKVVSISIFLDIMFYPIFAAYMWYAKDLFSEFNYSLSVSLLIPVASIILKFLAVKAIKADEKLVRSADRIR